MGNSERMFWEVRLGQLYVKCLNCPGHSRDIAKSYFLILVFRSWSEMESQGRHFELSFSIPFLHRTA